MPEIAGNERGGLQIRLLELIGDILFPKRCALCDGILPAGERLRCAKCRDAAIYVGEQYCMKCGKPVSEGEEFCVDCEGRKTSYECGRALFVYDSLMQRSIARFKYHGRCEYAQFYGEELYKHFGAWIQRLSPDALIPVPIHKKRYRKRGYNQAELVANELGKHSGVPVISDFLVRQKNTLPQKELSGGERFSNLCDAFCVRSVTQELYKGLNCVIIVDDIFTTGSTIEACSKILRVQGIKQIFFLCISIGQRF